MDDASLVHWLERRLPHWQRLRGLLSTQHDRDRHTIAGVMEVVGEFRALGRDLALARSLIPSARLSRDLEDLFYRAHETVYRRPVRGAATLWELIRHDVPRSVARMRGCIQVTACLFVASALVGWLLIRLSPELITLFASTTMVERVQQGQLWTDDLLNVTPSSVLSFSIMANNITVTFTAFALGALYGLGTLYIMTVNGLMLGAVFAYTARYELDGELFRFIVAHGVVELSVICLAGAAGLRLGQALVEPGRRSRVHAFREAALEAARLLPVVALLLVGAGLIEGYVSPDQHYSLGARVIVGAGYGAFMWLLLSGRLWRLRRGRSVVSPAPVVGH